jgi:pimeloyl-ACP methyl ester carboxylesterase
MKARLIAAIGAATVASAAGAATVLADRKVRAARRPGIAAQHRFAPPEPERAGVVRADDGVELYYEQDGPAGAPLTVVLVHGFCQNRDDLLFQRRALLAEFGARVRLISVDLRNHGRSGRSDPERASIDQLGADLFRVLDELVPDGPLVLVGHSMGAMSLLALADAHPALVTDRVAGVALIATSTGKVAALSLGLPAAVAAVSDPAVRLALRGMHQQHRLVERGRARLSDAAWMFVRKLAFGPHPDPGLVEFVAQMIAATPVDVIAEFYSTLMSHDKLAALENLRDLPVLVVCGECDLITPPDHSREIADRLPKSELVLVPEAGHQVLMERPDLVNPPLVRLVADALPR